ncbi:hypothetical protein C7H79_06500 [Nitrosomonas supralitoralis]|uniref:Histidine kinase n=2 Tax=Nitrosomonas supralitoralis TaxID=2116706 RepID=A0A2P7NWD1_9PROT|nr:hypothetical protein C7H79_06500 [Nitrosomonas supralitoralis]
MSKSTTVIVNLWCGLSALLILMVDFITPLGIASGVPYIIVILISLKSPYKRFTIAAAMLCTVLVWIGYVGSPPGDVDTYQIYINRFLSILAIWVTTILTLSQRDSINQLHQERLRNLQSRIETEIQQEKLKMLKATMRTVHDIIGNFLNNLHFFKLEIDRNSTLSAESIKKLDQLTQETTQRLDKLASVDEIREKKMAGDMVGIDYELTPKGEETTGTQNKLV